VLVVELVIAAVTPLIPSRASGLEVLEGGMALSVSLLAAVGVVT
jgi:hypothetical protein